MVQSGCSVCYIGISALADFLLRTITTKYEKSVKISPLTLKLVQQSFPQQCATRSLQQPGGGERRMPQIRLIASPSILWKTRSQPFFVGCQKVSSAAEEE